MAAKRVLTIGHCAADHGNIARTLTMHFDIEVVAADSAAEAQCHLRQCAFDLILINRVFDLDGSSGLDLIARLKKDDELKRVPMMLISNFEEYQQQAVGAGAVPGFGKSALNHPQTLDRLRKHLD